MKISLRYFQILTVIYLAVTSIVTLIMLFNAFEQSGEKYFPAFMLSQIYAMPLLLSALSLTFLVFFEPEKLQKKSVVFAFRIIFAAMIMLFGKYLSLQFENSLSAAMIVVLVTEEILILLVTLSFFSIKNK